MLSFSKDRKPEPTVLQTWRHFLWKLLKQSHSERTTQASLSTAKHLKTFLFFSFDTEAISRAVLNVVTNAIDAVEEQPHGKVEITAAIDEKSEVVRVVITDNGPGIPTETLPNIFNLFVSTKGAKGTGLGLTVSQKILREHGGDIFVESTPSQGSCFTLSFPLLFGEHTSEGSRGTVTDMQLPSDFDASMTP